MMCHPDKQHLQLHSEAELAPVMLVVLPWGQTVQAGGALPGWKHLSASLYVPAGQTAHEKGRY
jgi:hypothetical protein